MIPIMRTTINIIAASLMVSGILLLILLFFYYICIIIDTYQLGKQRKRNAQKIKENKVKELKNEKVASSAIKKE